MIGSHCIEFFAGVDEEADTEDEDDEMEVVFWIYVSVLLKIEDESSTSF